MQQESKVAVVGQCWPWPMGTSFGPPGPPWMSPCNGCGVPCLGPAALNTLFEVGTAQLLWLTWRCSFASRGSTRGWCPIQRLKPDNHLLERTRDALELYTSLKLWGLRDLILSLAISWQCSLHTGLVPWEFQSALLSAKSSAGTSADHVASRNHKCAWLWPCAAKCCVPSSCFMLPTRSVPLPCSIPANAATAEKGWVAPKSLAYQEILAYAQTETSFSNIKMHVPQKSTTT